MPPAALTATTARRTCAQDKRRSLIVYAALHSLDDHASPGIALAMQAPTRQALDTLLRDGLTCLRNDDRVGSPAARSPFHPRWTISRCGARPPRSSRL